MRFEVYLALMLLATGAALWRGTAVEKWVAGIVLTGNLLTFLLERLLVNSFASVSIIYLFLDLALALALIAIALKYPSIVSILVAACQINGTLGHVVRLTAADVIPFSYAFLLKVWAWPMVIAILVTRGMPRLRTIILERPWGSAFHMLGP